MSVICLRRASGYWMLDARFWLLDARCRIYLILTQVSHPLFGLSSDIWDVLFILAKRKWVFARGDILVYTEGAAGGPIFGMDGTAPSSIPMRRLNPKYWATWVAVIDIASRKNAFPGIQARN